VVSPWFGELETDSAFFSAKIPAEGADALLCEWAPSEELFAFPRRKAWYCCEPAVQFDGLGGGRWPSIRRRLDPSEFLCHDHPDARFRVPHITHFEELNVDTRAARKEGVIAVISNHGGNPRRRHPGLVYRNRFATHPDVALYGRPGWNHYRKTVLSLPRRPGNYLGEIPGDWPADAKRKLLSQYKVAIALENMNEPFYFTEKFVEAVRAGCVPIYHADEQSKRLYLEGASWVDPADFGHDPVRTITAALEMNIEDVQRRNHVWLRSSLPLRRTSHRAVFTRIGEILTS
jgi:hypothetical protein